MPITENDWRQKMLLRFSDNPADRWTVDDAIKGTSILGGTGSGKTTASGKKIAIEFLKQHWGGIVLCAKPEEAELWVNEYCAETNRQDDVILFSRGNHFTAGKHAGENYVFNPLDYEMTREGKGARETQNITNIFMNIYRMGNRIAGEGDTREERYWDTALKRCLNRTIELINLAGEKLTYQNIVKVITTSKQVDEIAVRNAYKEYEANPEEFEEAFSIKRAQHFCLSCLLKATINVRELPDDAAGVNAYFLALDYFAVILPQMSDKTRSVVIEMFMGLADPFLSGLLYEHFSGQTNIFPEQTFTEKKIIILDFAVKEFLDAGIVAQSIFKLMFQQAVERRDVKKYPTPVFLWADEAQYFINPYDQIFLTTARSSRAATVFLSQNISNYLAVIGSGRDAKARIDSLMGNLSTKIFHANSDAETNEYASRLIGSEIKLLTGAQESNPHFSMEKTETISVSSSFLPQIQPREFTELKTGGINNNFKVQAIIQCAGKMWSNGKNFFKVAFTQKFNNQQ